MGMGIETAGRPDRVVVPDAQGTDPHARRIEIAAEAEMMCAQPVQLETAKAAERAVLDRHAAALPTASRPCGAR